jgi:hypothetical protein
MKHLNDFIRVCPGVLDEEVCELLCLTFDMSKGKKKVKNEVIDFTELNLNVHHGDIISHLIGPTQEALSRYKSKLKYETIWFPTNTLALEEFRVKCYNSDAGEQFKTHVDVGDHNSARRFLSFLFYLNDDFTGGETDFAGGITVKPKRGSVLIFPPTWQYPHTGLPLKTGRKFIMSTYLHYT